MKIRNTQLHIRRFEFKYLIREQQVDAIRRNIANFVDVDFYAKPTGGNYRVTSIYFDDVHYNSYFEKLSGLKFRKKLRIRTYNEVTNNSAFFFEVKKRDDAIILKDRSYATYNDVKAFIRDGDYNRVDFKEDGRNNNEFITQFLVKKLKPTTLISYDREAYVDKKNDSFRITFDRNISVRRESELNFDWHDSRVIGQDFVVLEAKFNRIMPAWFGMVIRASELTRVAFSKYCFSMEACGILPRTELSYINSWI